MAENLIVVSKVKDIIKGLEMRSGDEFLTALNDRIHVILKEAAARAKGNGRATLRQEDL